MVLTAEFVEGTFSHSSFLQGKSSLDSLLPCMNEDHDLMALMHQLRDLLKGGAFQVLARLGTTWLSSDANEMLLQGYRPERRVEVEKSNMATHAQKIGDIDVVG